MRRRTFMGSALALAACPPALAQAGFYVEPDLSLPPVGSDDSHKRELRITLEKTRKVNYFFLTLSPLPGEVHYDASALEILRRAGVVGYEDKSRNFRPVEAGLGSQAFLKTVTLDPVITRSLFPALRSVLPVTAEVTGHFWFGILQEDRQAFLIPQGNANIGTCIVAAHASLCVALADRPLIPAELSFRYPRVYERIRLH